jgi:hypothetical protein
MLPALKIAKIMPPDSIYVLNIKNDLSPPEIEDSSFMQLEKVSGITAKQGIVSLQPLC